MAERNDGDSQNDGLHEDRELPQSGADGGLSNAEEQRGFRRICEQ